ncbi:hypothetical protein FQR65_LT13328 [Abscondita terminalis]|nr:hypothetical protein FQR65_LT13328 [Abscondita terminalis]
MHSNSLKFFFLIHLLIQIYGNANTTQLDLVTVSVIYRHGDRSPFEPYPTDPYRYPQYWPMGYAQLTNIGKMQQYQLGQYLRKRYDNFLSPNYNVSEIHVRSTDTDRTLMSVESNLAGLYPPTPDQMWNPNLLWQPIPIHTAPVELDYILAMKKPCEKYQQLVDSLIHSSEFVEIDRKNRKLYEYLTKNTGQKIKDLASLQNVYNVLYIEKLYNLTLAEWSKTVYSDLQKWSDFSFSVATYTPEMAHLRTGPLLNEISSHLENATRGHSKKFYVYSAHDTTIADVLNTLGLFEYHSPPYTATILFELRVKNSSYFVNVLYKNSTEPQRMLLSGCDYDCPLSQFLKIMEPLRINHQEWEFACQPKFLGFMPFNTLQRSIFTGCMGLLFILLCSFVISLICSRRRRRANVDYVRLLNEEIS